MSPIEQASELIAAIVAGKANQGARAMKTASEMSGQRPAYCSASEAAIILQAIAAIRSWRGKPESVAILLAEYERIVRELQEARTAELP